MPFELVSVIYKGWMMSKHSRNDGRQPEQYARLSESPSEDESDEEFRQFLLAKGDQNDPAVRDMLKTIDRDRYERSAANGGPTLEYESHGLLALTVPHLHLPRPGQRAFMVRGVVLKSLWFLFVFVVSVVVQVVFMDVAKANGSGDWWPLMAVPNVGVFVIVFASIALSPFIVYAIGSLWPRLTVPFVMFASLAMLAVGSFVGQEVGRRWLWDRYVATGLLKPGDFVDWSSDRLPAPLAQPASGGWWVIGLVAGVLLVSGSLFLCREDRHRGSNILPRYISYGGGVVGLVAAIGIALTRHVSGFALVAAPFIALFVGLLWFPLDLAAACFCVDNRRESCGEWPAAFWLTAEALFVIGVCTALPMA